jgi:hypothetical protein
MRQALVVCTDLGVLDHLSVRVVQALPPRLAVVRVAAEGVAALVATPGVQAVGTPVLPDSVRSGLTAQERLFADAFEVAAAPKTRIGEGLAWDSPGFLPPDIPPRSS